MERLADSINDTARMARASLVLVMLVALYLSLTLLSSTDEQLLRESDVAVPQINIGVSIKTNYTIGPLIFLYLHIQTLFLLSVLARKIRGFTETSAEKRHWNWLSAFIFVQLFRPIDEHSRITSQVRRWLSMILCCISIAVIPVLLLIVIDLSFVRYQSVFITNSHHWILVLDVISVIMFSMYIIWLYEKRIRKTLCKNSILGNIIDRSMLLLCVASMLLFLLVCILQFNIQPLQFDRSETANVRADIWKEDENKYLSKNLLGFVLCDWLDVSCRYHIDVNGELLANPGIVLPDDTGTKRVHAERLDLAERKLRYACFRSTELHHVDLRSADLSGADFGSAKIYNSNLSNAELHDAIFADATLNSVDIAKAKLHGANLSGAELRNADIAGAELYGANLSNTQGIGTKGCVPSDDENTGDEDTGSYNKSNTILHGADLRFAKLRDANLEGAELHGANLSFADLHGANLRGAELYGANLRNANLHGVDLEGAKLDGADLGNAKLEDSFGAPKSWNFVWMPNTSSLTGMEDVRIYWEEESVTKSIWEDRSEWAADFACRDEYNARVVLKRWNSETPLSNIKPKSRCMAISTIVRALKVRKGGKEEECLGLHNLPNDEWLEFLSSTRNWMEQLKEEIIHGQCGGIPKTDRRVGR